jgi:hypothetical protein
MKTPQLCRSSTLVRVVVTFAVLVVATVVLPLATGHESVARANGDPSAYTVTVAPNTDLIDGQRVTITTKVTAGHETYPVYQVEAKLCRAGVTYQGSLPPHNRPNEDALTGGANCPSLPISSSADKAAVNVNVLTQAQGNGSVTTMRVGTGSITWTNIRTNAPESLNCDLTNPCVLLVEVLSGDPATWVATTVPISYRIDDPIAGCGGPATGVLATGGSDRMSDAWVRWTLTECRKAGRTGAAGRASFQGEGAALTSYSSGSLDLAYTSAGYNANVGLTTSDVTLRPSVAVPLAINATVLALGGGTVDTSDQKVPYRDVKLMATEVAHMFGGGYQAVIDDYPAIQARNPEMQNGFFDVNNLLPYAYADAESTSYSMSSYLKTLAPDQFRVPNTPNFGSDAGRARVANSAWALADPSYALSVALLTGRPSLVNKVNSAAPVLNGAVFVLTDLDTANTLGLTPAQIENSHGDFVGPTAESIAAGVAAMKPDANGLLQLDPTATAPAGQTQPYPLTQVEYALVPAAPLADATGACRADTQALLADWLTYVTTDGQHNLPAGLLPLPEPLKSQAAAAIEQVGATPGASPCTSATATTTTTTSGPARSDLLAPGSGGAPVAAFSGSPSGSFGSSASSSSGALAPTSPSTGKAELAASTTDIPDYGGGRVPSAVVAMLSLVGLVVLMLVAAKITAASGKRGTSSG